MRRIKHILEYLILIIILTTSNPFSWQSLPYIGRLFGTIVYLIIRMRRRVAIENIKLALNLGENKARKIALSSFISIATTIFEITHLGLKYHKDPSKLIKFSRFDVFERAKNDRNGAILLSAHYGNWEIMASVIAKSGYNARAIVKRQANPYVENLFVRLRKRYGIRVLYMENSAREIIRLLKKNEFVAVLADQYAGESGIMAEFFGRKASTWGQIGRIAQIANSPIITGLDMRLVNNKHFAVIDDLWYIKSKDNAERNFAEEYNRRLEHLIKFYPQQYLWMHRRWK